MVSNWALHKGLGWRSCGQTKTLESCRKMCESMMSCTMYSWTPSGCCFPYKVTS
jgi:hypothetical protein